MPTFRNDFSFENHNGSAPHGIAKNMRCWNNFCAMKERLKVR